MPSICSRCALRLQRAAQLHTPHLTTRTFTSSSPKPLRAIPTFSESSNAELNGVLSSFREKHLIPAYLHEDEQKLIFRNKYKQQLEDSPQTATVGDEEIQLQWIDRQKEIPKRKQLITKAVNLIIRGESKDWQNLPKLMQGMNEGMKRPVDGPLLEKIMRKASEAGKMGVIIQCLQQAKRTGMTLKDKVVLRNVLLGLHNMAQKAEWSSGATARALREANVIAQLLEDETHGTGNRLDEHDPRVSPMVLGQFLELAAVYAYKHADGKDTDGLVKAYAGRLAKALQERGNAWVIPRSETMDKKTRRHWAMLTSIPVWHGLSLAEHILGSGMPDILHKTKIDYENALLDMAAELEARHPKGGSYDHEALSAWRACIRP